MGEETEGGVKLTYFRTVLCWPGEHLKHFLVGSDMITSSGNKTWSRGLHDHLFPHI